MDEMCRSILLDRERALGLVSYEYTWADPDELSCYGDDCWRIVPNGFWCEGRLLMRRKRPSIVIPRP